MTHQSHSYFHFLHTYYSIRFLLQLIIVLLLCNYGMVNNYKKLVKEVATVTVQFVEHIHCVNKKINYKRCSIVFIKMLKSFSYYACIMLKSFIYLLCSKLCWHNQPVPTYSCSVSTFLMHTVIKFLATSLSFHHSQACNMFGNPLIQIAAVMQQQYTCNLPLILPCATYIYNYVCVHA